MTARSRTHWAGVILRCAGGGLGAAGATTIATSLDGYSYLTHLDVAGTLLEQMGLHIRIASRILLLVAATIRWGKRFAQECVARQLPWRGRHPGLCARSPQAVLSGAPGHQW